VKYAVLTFGCRTNQADSFAIERELRAQGGEEAPVTTADVVVVNTCAVTASAEQSARRAIRRARRVNPHARILAAGCYAERAASEVRSLPISDLLSRGHTPSTLLAPPLPGTPLPGPGTRGRTIYLLQAQTGCDERCSYCVVPSTRGPGRSRTIDAVMREVSVAAAAGFKDVMLTGVHLGSFGRDLSPARALAELLRQLSRHPAPVRFRLSSVEPMDVDADLVAAIADSGRFAQHFHLPLQHASDRVLAAMARPYTLADYDGAVGRLRHAFPDAALGADVIVGFPGETEADFEACAQYLTASPLTYLHVFPFSPRPGTPAALLDGRPRGEDVRRRIAALRSVGADMARSFRRRFVGAIVDGLTIEDGSLVMTDNYLRVRIPAGPTRNERVRVKIVADGEPMTGVVVAP
jgi:threonylcarbamoyladenosine tRNA methylthiotransferase MtaB